MIKIIDGQGKNLDYIIGLLDRPLQLNFDEERTVVNKILQDVKNNGDEAVLKYTNKFDKTHCLCINDLIVSDDEIQEAYHLISPEVLKALKKSADNIEKYHKNQIRKNWITLEDDGVILGQLISPISRVGIYVPGGRSSYPSSVLMNALPAKIAKVEQIIMVTPPGKDGKVNPAVLVAANIAKVDRIYKIGGAQAIGALAYGSESVPRVDKIVGPGNIYVTLAKKEVFGFVDIDMIAGPSEILIIADDSANPSFVAADLISQAEHDPLATSILITNSPQLSHKVKNEIYRQTKDICTENTIKSSLSKYGCILVVDDIKTAVKVSNVLAPEHLEIMVDDSQEYLSLVKNAGAIFLGPFSPEPVGDYIAGSNHVLPTSGTARFSSPLGVDDFIKKSSFIKYTRKALSKTYKDIAYIARSEGLEAHARCVEMRFDNNEISL